MLTHTSAHLGAEIQRVENDARSRLRVNGGKLPVQAPVGEPQVLDDAGLAVVDE